MYLLVFLLSIFLSYNLLLLLFSNKLNQNLIFNIINEYFYLLLFLVVLLIISKNIILTILFFIVIFIFPKLLKFLLKLIINIWLLCYYAKITSKLYDVIILDNDISVVNKYSNNNLLYKIQNHFKDKLIYNNLYILNYNLMLDKLFNKKIEKNYVYNLNRYYKRYLIKYLMYFLCIIFFVLVFINLIFIFWR